MTPNSDPNHGPHVPHDELAQSTFATRADEYRFYRSMGVRPARMLSLFREERFGREILDTAFESPELSEFAEAHGGKRAVRERLEKFIAPTELVGLLTAWDDTLHAMIQNLAHLKVSQVQLDITETVVAAHISDLFERLPTHTGYGDLQFNPCPSLLKLCRLVTPHGPGVPLTRHFKSDSRHKTEHSLFVELVSQSVTLLYFEGSYLQVTLQGTHTFEDPPRTAASLVDEVIGLGSEYPPSKREIRSMIEDWSGITDPDRFHESLVWAQQVFGREPVDHLYARLSPSAVTALTSSDKAPLSFNYLTNEEKLACMMFSEVIRVARWCEVGYDQATKRLHDLFKDAINPIVIDVPHKLYRRFSREGVLERWESMEEVKRALLVHNSPSGRGDLISMLQEKVRSLKRTISNGTSALQRLPPDNSLCKSLADSIKSDTTILKETEYFIRCLKRP